jgi:hypothetical protein
MNRWAREDVELVGVLGGLIAVLLGVATVAAALGDEWASWLGGMSALTGCVLGMFGAGWVRSHADRRRRAREQPVLEFYWPESTKRPRRPPLSQSSPCDHGRGPVSDIEYGWMPYWMRNPRRLFRKTLRQQCCFCGEARWSDG